MSGDAPKLEGLSRSYLTRQIKDFIRGQRGYSIDGRRCAVDALSRLAPADVLPTLDHFTSGAPHLAGGDAPVESVSTGESLYRSGRLQSGIQPCAACHGWDGTGGVQRGLDSAAVAPRLAGQRADYVVSQLRSFRSGARTNDFGGIMQRMVADLTDRDYAAVAAYVARLDPAAVAPEPVAITGPMPALAALCQACHGQDGEGVADSFPKLAGLSPGQITKQLRDIQAGRRAVDAMAPVVYALSDAEMTEIGNWFSRFEMHQGPYDPHKAQRGEKLFLEGNTTTGGYPACMFCHGMDGRGLAGVEWAPGDVPRLAGQHPGYLRKALRDFRSGARTNDYASLMRLVAVRMTDAEIDDVSHYLYSLGEKPVRSPQE